MINILFLVVLSVPRYLVIDVKGTGMKYLEDQGVKVIEQVDSVTYLVEGNIEEMDHTPYEIAIFKPYVKAGKAHLNRGKYYIPDLSEIDYYFSMVSQDSIYGILNRLQEFVTRFAYTDSCRRAEQYLVNKLQEYSDSAYLWPFTHNGYVMNNAVGLRDGEKDDFILITSHLDSYSQDPWNYAPGADDNASGTAVVIECARLLQDISEPMMSIQFVPFSAEELGLIGSENYADYVVENNLPLMGVLNFDMVGYNPQDGLDFDVNMDSLSLFGQIVKHVIENYVPTSNRYTYSPFSGSDHYPFAMRGYPWAFFIESNYQYNPNYHRTTDLVSTLDAAQMVSSVKVALGTALYFALLPLPPESLVVVNTGNGEGIKVSWPSVSYPDSVSYRIYRGTSPNTLSFLMETSDTFSIVSGHEQNLTYYYMVQTHYKGRSGFGTPVESILVDNIPSTPQLLSLEPLRNGIKLYWRPNSELDLLGYHVYRSDNGSFERITPNPVLDTFFVDMGATSPIWYSYRITAVDESLQESSPSDSLRGRPVTLSEGILVIDDFRDGNGTPISPNGFAQRAFIDSVLQETGVDTFEVIDVSQVPTVTLSDMGIYSMVWVMSDDVTEFLGSKYKDAVPSYLHFGGKVLFEGYKNSVNLGIVNTYPARVGLNYLGLPVDSVFLNTRTDFSGATSTIGVEFMPDMSKLLPSWNGNISNVEAYTLNGGQPLFYFDSNSDDPAFEGRVCGFKVGDSIVYLGFPLYYMRKQDVVSFMTWLAESGFLKISEPFVSRSFDIILTGNYFTVPGIERGKISIFSIEGRLIKSGEYFKSGFYVADLKNGVYVFEISDGDKTLKTGKIIRVK